MGRILRVFNGYEFYYHPWLIHSIYMLAGKKGDKKKEKGECML